jgi:methyltransferase family protein
VGLVAPFVLKRVFNLETGFAPSRHPLKRFLRRITVFNQAADRIFGKLVLLDIQTCTTCSFVQTKVPLPEEGIARLYVDYRSDSYNRERIHYEPAYASIAHRVGTDPQEVISRQDSLNSWLSSKLDVGEDFSMLDYGGANGQFLPALPGRKYVFEISDIAPIAGVERIVNDASLETYSYAQLAHVLEHVPFPLELTRQVCSYLRPKGYLYVELPQDLSDEQIAQFSSGNGDMAVTIHEHINYYTKTSATKLLESAGLSVIDVQATDIDLGWNNKARFIRALGRKSD